MLHCSRCKIDIKGDLKRCPLCQGDLTGTAQGDNAYPYITTRPHRKLFAWIAFGAVAVAVISVAVNLSFPAGGLWSLFVVGGIASLSLAFATILKKKSNIPKTILWQVGIFTVLSLIWDWVTGFHGWSINFVIPIFCTCAMILMAAVSKVLRLDIQDYIIYLVIDAILGVLSFILIVVDVLYVVYPSAICFACSVISMAALIIFEGRALWTELYRRTHL